ncbi:MAG: family 78 glycoside hydrolase catalytic domain [Clostridiales bacterium]|nr:family 78 glycoside hydrolase catalytic domain [Clostridiales bacterium]
MLTCEDLTVQYQSNPIGLDIKQPHFSWILRSEEKNVVQTTYCLTVTDETGTAVWNSGVVQSDSSVLVPYGGEPLQKQTRYAVSVAVTDSLGRAARAEGSFETGLFAEFSAEFISYREAAGESFCPVFEKRFCLEKPVRRARLYATALGMYEAELNGQKTGNAFFAPGWTNYRKRLQYQTYDVTKQLKQENVLRFTLANGWYKGEFVLDQRCMYGSRTAVLAELHVLFQDGSSAVIGTDESWLEGVGQILESEIYHGETIDTTLPLFTPRGNAVVIEQDKSVLTAQENIPVQVHERLGVQQVIVTPAGKTVLEIGQTMSALVEVQLKAPRGSRIVLRHGEVLDHQGELYTENLRTARCTDTFIASGEEQTLMAHFTYHGFRYVQVEGLEEIKPECFTACVLHSGMRRTGSFECSNRLVNQLWHNILWGQKSNFVDVPTDCPQRDERLGWTGDAQIFCHTSTLQMNVALFYEKWLRDLASEQTPEYGVPHVIPNVLGLAHGAAAWGDAATVIPWELYRQYGDKNVLREQYVSMKMWVDYITSLSPNGLWQANFQYGDWLALDKEEGSDRTGATDPYLISSAFYAYSADLTAKAAAVLGEEADAERYSALHEKIVQAFREEYITPNGRIVSQTQTGLALALMLGLFEQKHIDGACKELRRNLEAHTNHLVTGFVGTPYLCNVLSDFGMHDIAAVLVQQRDYPSWLYAVLKGATTVWERWNGIKPDGSFETASMNSFNHYAYGAVGSWLVEKLAGISAADAGYKRIKMQPRPAVGFERASAVLETPYGTAKCGYTCKNGTLNVHVCVPCNTKAELILPEGHGTQLLGSGEYDFSFPTELALHKDAYTAQTKLITILQLPEARRLLEQRCPEFFENTMLDFFYEKTLADAAIAIPCDFAHFQAVLDMLNAE